MDADTPESNMDLSARNRHQRAGGGIGDAAGEVQVSCLRQMLVEFGILVGDEIERAVARGAGAAGGRRALGHLQLGRRLRRHRQVELADQLRIEIVEVGLRDLRAIEVERLRRVGPVRHLAEQPQIVLVALVGARPRLQQRVRGLLRVLPLEEPHVLRQRLQRHLMRLAQQRELLALALLDRRKQRRAECAHFAGQFQRLLDEVGRTHRTERLIEPGDDAGDIDASRPRLDEHAGIERRIEQRQLLNDALNVLTVADLEEAVRDGVPVGKQGLVLRYAEIERAADAEQCAALIDVRPVNHARS